ncbi:MAG: YceI family protein [Flavobacterium sp.]
MKNLKTIATTLVLTLSLTTMVAQTKKINTEKSKITWLAKKVTGQHEGTINFADGALVFKGEKVKGGSFTVDMPSLTATDLKGEYLEKLNGHLKADDFFGTATYPTSKLVFKKIATKDNKNYTVTADLTIKNITNPVVFDLVVNGNTAKTVLKIDRTKYDIKYNSGKFFDNLGDKTIYDEFELTVNLVF